MGIQIQSWGGELRSHADDLRLRIAARLRLGVRSTTLRYGLRRDLHAALQEPSAKIPISVRPLSDGDIPFLLDHETSPADRTEAAWRRKFLKRFPERCVVAVDGRDGTACYMQWLLRPEDNAAIAELGGFPPLASDEGLLENAYTPARYRGLGIMSVAMAQIAERASEFGARYVLTFVERSNVASLKGCQRAGFHPHLLHRRSQMLFGLLKTDRFDILADADPRRTIKF